MAAARAAVDADRQRSATVFKRSTEARRRLPALEINPDTAKKLTLAAGVKSFPTMTCAQSLKAWKAHHSPLG
jgi:hypothetical protein